MRLVNNLSFYFFLFIFASVAATILEFFTGIFLEKVFGVVYWSYDGILLKNSFSKFICAPISLCWGILSLIIIKFVHPKVIRLFNRISDKYIYVFLIYFFVDLSVTLLKYAN